MNFKKDGLILAMRQFLKDLQNDKDFIEFRKNCNIAKGAENYGCVVVTDGKWLINDGISSQTIISKFKKQIKHNEKTNQKNLWIQQTISEMLCSVQW